MWTTVLELLLLSRPESTPPAFWRWFKRGRVALVITWVAGLIGLIILIAVHWATGGAAWGTLFSDGMTLPPQASGPLPSLYLLIPLGFVLLFPVLRRPAYSWAKKRFYALLRQANFEVCQTCAYSLKGLPDLHRCPECGTVFHRDATRRSWERWMMMNDEDWPEDSSMFRTGHV